MWTRIWDNRFAHSSYIHFEEYCVKVLYRYSIHPCEYSLSNKIKRFLKPKDFGGPPTVTHNWGDWYYFEDSTMVRIYGF